VYLLNRTFPRFALVIAGLIVGILAASAIFSSTGFSIFGQPKYQTEVSAGINNAELTALAFRVLEYIRDENFKALSEIVHPDFGVVFSPGATINLTANRRFNADQIAVFGSDNTVYVWGVVSDTGEPIELTPVDYFSQFVYSDDYSNASIIGVDHIVRSGNALENITEEFPGIRFVDFHIPGGDRDTPEDLNWSSLRLGFEKLDDLLWLTVVVHSTWTV